MALLAALASSLPACTDLSSDCQLNASCPDGTGTGGSAGTGASTGTGIGAGTGTGASAGSGMGGASGSMNGGNGGEGAGGSAGAGGTTTGPACGDGDVDPGEYCDDANSQSGDGCGNCFVEPGWMCSGQPSNCTPAARPPYVMIAFDTSASMDQPVSGAASSCGYGTSRLDHARCAVKQAVAKHEGKVRFGLSTFAAQMQGCGATCFTTCNFMDLPGNIGLEGCGPKPGTPLTRAGGFVRVGIAADNPPPSQSNLTELLEWMDNDCAGDKELFAFGSTPINGVLRDMYRYFELGWKSPDGSAQVPSPVVNGDKPAGTGCLSLNVMLITDGAETCDTEIDAISAASDLYTGVDAAGHLFPVKTHVVNMVQANGLELDAVAFAGGTEQSYLATNETGIQSAIDAVVSKLGCP